MPVVPEHVLLGQHEAETCKSGEEAEQFVPTPIVAGERMLARNVPDDVRVDEVRDGKQVTRTEGCRGPPISGGVWMLLTRRLACHICHGDGFARGESSAHKIAGPTVALIDPPPRTTRRLGDG